MCGESSIPLTAIPRPLKRQGDTAGPDRQLERRSLACQLGEQVNGRFEHRRGEHRRRTGVVGLGHVTAPGDRRHRHAPPDATRNPRLPVELSGELALRADTR